MRRLLLCAFIAGAIAPLELPAQQPREELRRAQTYSWYVRATRGDSIVASGRVRALTNDAVRIDTTSIRFSELTTLERRTKVGGGWRRGALAGSVAMGVLGGLFMGGFCEYSETQTGSCALAFVGGAAFGVAIGFPLGGMIGAAAQPGRYEWQTIWPAARN